MDLVGVYVERLKVFGAVVQAQLIAAAEVQADALRRVELGAGDGLAKQDLQPKVGSVGDGLEMFIGLVMNAAVGSDDLPFAFH